MTGTDLFIAWTSGLACGLIACLWFKFLIKSRSALAVNKTKFVWINLGVSLGIALAVVLITSDHLVQAVLSLYGLTLLTLSSVDFVSRKIPNPTLLALILIRSLELFIRQEWTGFLGSFFGLAAGFVFFQLPVLTGRTIGWGDVKLAAVIGYCLGWRDLLISVGILGLGIGIFYLLLILTKRGNLKTKVAIGPFLSLGMMVTVLFNAFVA